MREEEINTEEVLAGDDGVASSDDSKAVSEQSEQSKGIKDVLSEVLGKDFKSDDAALKAVKDTFSYVGKKGENLLRQQLEDPLFSDDLQKLIETKKSGNENAKVEDNNVVSRDQYENDRFYDKNPQYQPYRKILNGLRSDGMSLEDTVKSEDFKTLFEKASAFDETEKSKSILHSNPRLGQVTDKVKQSKQDLKDGKVDTAISGAVGSVLDAYESK